ncbi:hypothetical protein CSX04_05778 [Burkholderia cepacia]|nr:hypothetical protein CSX04_05778 [Burkholderia cepacia]
MSTACARPSQRTRRRIPDRADRLPCRTASCRPANVRLVDGACPLPAMRVLPNRTFRARDDWRAILNARADARRTARCRCRECGFVAFRALEHCPVCGQWDWPFDPVHRTPDDARTPHAVQRFDSWSSRVTRTLRNAAFRRPRASSAPILSILTLVLLVGGYVMVDRTCNADPVCRGSRISGARRAMRVRTCRTIPCCRSCRRPPIRFIRLMEPRWRPRDSAARMSAKPPDGPRSRGPRRPTVHPIGRMPPPRFGWPT